MSNTNTAGKHDRIIAELVAALAQIHRQTAYPPECDTISIVRGIAEQAMKNCNAQRERNADGYLVVKAELLKHSA